MSILERFSALLFPDDCLSCGCEGNLLCNACWRDIPPLPGRCFRCYQLSPGAVSCADCIALSPLASIRVVTAYDAVPRQLIAKLKFQGNQSAAACIARAMATGVRLPPDALLTYMPATTAHIRQRGYDQARLIARIIGRHTGNRHTRLLARTGQAHQLGAGRDQRLKQLGNALTVVKPHLVRGRHIIIVDDVLTTGASLQIAAECLLAADAQRVDGWVFAQA